MHHEANLSGFVAFGLIVSRPFPHHSSTAGGRFSSFLRTRGIFTRPSALYIGMSGAKIFLKQHETATGTCIGAVALTPVRACACIFLLFCVRCMRVFSLPFLKQSLAGVGHGRGIGLPCWHAWGWQAWHLWHWNGPGGALWAWRLRGSLRGMGHPRRGRRGTHGTGFALVAWLGLAGAAGLCVARVALDDIDIAFVWQAAWAGALANTYFFDFLTPMRFPTRYTGLARSTETLRYR